MKLTKLTSLLLTTTTLATVIVLSSCKKTDDMNLDTPFDSTVFTEKNQPLLNPTNSSYNPKESNGALKMYSASKYKGAAKYGDLCVDNTLRYYDFQKPEHIADETPLCFDPLCEHLYDGTCQGRIIGYYGEYPTFVFFDLYDHADAGVLYIGYKQANCVTVNGEEIERPNDYCFERYDLSTGKREVIANNLKNTVTEMCTYGDYIYFVESTTAKSASLCLIHKSGSSVKKLEGITASSIRILNIEEDTVYFVADEETIYSATVKLENPQKCIDLQNLCGDNNTQGVFQTITGGYLYYFANYEKVSVTDPNGKIWDGDTMCDVFRVPLSDFTAKPEKIVDNIVASLNLFYSFTENTFYYQPMVYRCVPKKDFYAISISDGQLFALDLNTLENKVVAKDTGLTIMIHGAYDDVVLFGGHWYDAIGEELSGEGMNQLLGYANGDSYKMWISYNGYPT